MANNNNNNNNNDDDEDKKLTRNELEEAFPFQPYPIQLEMMMKIFHVLDGKQIGFFESPTGTGKSLSLAVATLVWLQKNSGFFVESQAASVPLEECCLENNVLNGLKEIFEGGSNADPPSSPSFAAATTNHNPLNSSPDIPAIKSLPEWMRSVGQEKEALRKEEARRQFQEKLAQKKKVWQILKLEMEKQAPSKDIISTLPLISKSKAQNEMTTNPQAPTQSSKLLKSSLVPQSSSHTKYSNVFNHNFSNSKTNFNNNSKTNFSNNSKNNFNHGKTNNSHPTVVKRVSQTGNSTPPSDISQKKKKLDIEFEMDEYHSDPEPDTKNSALFDDDDVPDPENWHPRQIYYCSRTHSQLSQFLEELHKTKFYEKIKVVALGGRKQLCVNDDVLGLVHAKRINEKCLELQSEASGGCMYHPKNATVKLEDHILAQVHDIEDLGHLGRRYLACPYYGAKAAVQWADLVTLPYNMLFHKSTRESLGIDLRGSVVIVDEAHNLTEAINSMYTVDLELIQLRAACFQVTTYIEKFQNRLKAKNLIYIKQTQFLVEALLTVLEKHVKASKASKDGPAAFAKLLTLNDFQFQAGIDNMNLYKIAKYFDKSDLVRKVSGYIHQFHESKIDHFK